MNATVLTRLVMTWVIIGLLFIACQQPSPTPTSTPSPTLVPTPTATPTTALVPTVTPLSTPTPASTATPALVPSPTPTPVPTPRPTPTTMASPTSTPTPTLAVGAQRYTLTIVEVGLKGVVKQSPPPDSDGKYGRNTQVTLSVGTMPSDWAFEGWSGAVNASTPTITVVMDLDKVLTATFKEMTAAGATPQPVAGTPTPAGPPGTVLLPDPTGDWAYPSGALTSAWGNLTSPDPNSPRPAPLPVPFIDFKSVALRVDGDSLVVKYQVAAPLPRTKDDFPTIAGQRIAGFSIWMPIDTVNNPNSGESFAEAWLFNGWSVLPDGRLNEEVSYLLDPSPGLPIQPFGYYTAKKARLLSGGPGHDYLEVSYPLNNLGVRPDQTIILGVFARATDQQNRTVSGDFLGFPTNTPGIWSDKLPVRLDTGLVPWPGEGPPTPLLPLVNDLPSCGDRQEFFTTAPMPLSDLQGMNPIGQVVPALGHLFPMPFVAFNPRTTVRADGREVPVEVPFVAPGDMKVLVISRFTLFWEGKLLGSSHSVWFAPCREVIGRISFLTSLAPGLMEKLQSPYPFSEPEVLPGEYELTGGNPNKTAERVYLRAGDPMGTVGGNPEFVGVEFQLLDYRTPPLSYANPSRWAVGYKQVVCPIDYFTPEVRDALRAKLGGPEGLRTAEPRCGEIAVDKPGTAQGYWFVPGSYWGASGFVGEGMENIEKIITLIPYFGDPNLLVFSIGTSMQKSGLPPAQGTGLTFLPRHSGAVNRDFKEVTADGQVYCYQELFWIVGNHPGNAQRVSLPSTIILLQLTSPTTLRLERQTADTCGSGPWQFGTTYTDFER